MPIELTKGVVEDWVKSTSGWWHYRDLDKDLEIGTPKGKATRRKILQRLCEEGITERHPKEEGRFRLVDNQAPLIDWQTADSSNVLDLRWPFEIEKWVSIYPKNVAVIAGTFNAGKTAFCLSFIEMNQHRPEISSLLPIQYFNSEMGPEEMKLRLSKFTTSDWAFEARERSTNFADVIKPNKINIIDYLEVTTDFYLVSQEITSIFNKLNKGIALIAVQKKQGSILGRGAEFSAEKPRLYLSMESGQLTIVKGKNWAVEGQNPNNKQFKFKLIGGHKFVSLNSSKEEESPFLVE
jgi:hypothetical protein